MRLPMPLVSLRSTVAQGLGLGLRLCEPVCLRLRRFAYEAWARAHIRGRVEAGVQFVGPVVVEGTGNIHIGRGTRIGRNVFFETYDKAAIVIGRGVTINDGVLIAAHSGVDIADMVMVGEYTSIRDANHGMRKGEYVRWQAHECAPVRIGRDVWIGRGVIVAKGVALEDGAVVGANSMVNKDVPENTIVAGAPAKPVGKRSE